MGRIVVLDTAHGRKKSISYWIKFAFSSFDKANKAVLLKHCKNKLQLLYKNSFHNL
jgi:hypothetical protein